MQQNKLGKSDLSVSALGFGAMSLSGENRQEDIRLIKEAYFRGINYFDTADLYGKGANEILLGEALKEVRKDICLATKVGNVWREDGKGWDWNVSKSYIYKAADASLRRLQTDYLDLYQLHGGTTADNYDEVIETFERLKDMGKIRSYGLSSIRPNVFKYYATHSGLDTNMMQFSILDTRPEEYLDFFESNQVSVIARGALGQGLLVDKKPQAYLDFDINTVASIKQKVNHIAAQHNVSNLAVALYYVLKHNPVSSALIGVRTLWQLEDLLRAYKEMRFLEDNAVKELGPTLFYKAHRS